MSVDREQLSDFFRLQILEKTKVNHFLLPDRQLIDRVLDLFFEGKFVFTLNEKIFTGKFGVHILRKLYFFPKRPDRFEHAVAERLDQIKFDRGRIIDRIAVQPEVHEQILQCVLDKLHVGRKPLSVLDQRAIVALRKFGVSIFIPAAEVIPKNSIVGIF